MNLNIEEEPLRRPSAELPSVEISPNREMGVRQSSVLELLVRAAGSEENPLDLDTRTDLENIPDGSIGAIADHGLSEMLGDDQKRAFVSAAFAKLQPGGMYSLLHRSRRGDTSVGAGRTRQELEALLPPGVEYLLDWNEMSLPDRQSGIERFSWSTIVRTPGSDISVMDLLDKAVALKTNSGV